MWCRTNFTSAVFSIKTIVSIKFRSVFNASAPLLIANFVITLSNCQIVRSCSCVCLLIDSENKKHTAKVGQDNVNIGVVTIFRLANTSLAFYADALWACHAILGEEDCVTSPKSVCLGG